MYEKNVSDSASQLNTKKMFDFLFLFEQLLFYLWAGHTNFYEVFCVFFFAFVHTVVYIPSMCRANLLDRKHMQPYPQPNSQSLPGGYSRLWHKVVDYIPQYGTKNLATEYKLKSQICKAVKLNLRLDSFLKTKALPIWHKNRPNLIYTIKNTSKPNI